MHVYVIFIHTYTAYYIQYIYVYELHSTVHTYTLYIYTYIQYTCSTKFFHTLITITNTSEEFEL